MALILEQRQLVRTTLEKRGIEPPIAAPPTHGSKLSTIFLSGGLRFRGSPFLDIGDRREGDHEGRSLPGLALGSVVVVWGGGYNLITGGRYDPATDQWTPTATLGAPAPQSSYTTVWTGSLMILWGGTMNGATLEVSGGRYDPVADTWTPTSNSGAPTARSAHSAVWTGQLMIVSGSTYRAHLDTGARYDPSRDAWTPTTTVGAPVGRVTHAAVWTGDMMIVWGGYGDGGYLQSGGRYRPGDLLVNDVGPEICDGVDNDCNGLVDDVPGAGDSCTISEDNCHQAFGTLACVALSTGIVCTGDTTVLHDITPPSLELPDDLEIDAAMPSGAAVSYSASADDLCAGVLTASCSPPPGSVFPINAPGLVTTVVRAAADPEGNGVSGHFTVHVAGAAEQLSDLRLLVGGLHLRMNLEKHLQRILTDALKSIAAGKTRQTCGKVMEFDGLVGAGPSGKTTVIPPGQSGVLLDASARIRSTLGC